MLKQVVAPTKIGKLFFNWKGPYLNQYKLSWGAYKLESLEGEEVPKFWNIVNSRQYYSLTHPLMQYDMCSVLEPEIRITLVLRNPELVLGIPDTVTRGWCTRLALQHPSKFKIQDECNGNLRLASVPFTVWYDFIPWVIWNRLAIF